MNFKRAIDWRITWKYNHYALNLLDLCRVLSTFCVRLIGKAGDNTLASQLRVLCIFNPVASSPLSALLLYWSKKLLAWNNRAFIINPQSTITSSHSLRSSRMSERDEFITTAALLSCSHHKQYHTTWCKYTTQFHVIMYIFFFFFKLSLVWVQVTLW